MSLRTLIPLVLLTSACAGGQGTVQITTWGEESVPEGFPPERGEDGWDLTFDHWLMSVADIRLHDPDDDSRIAEADGSWVIDVTTAEAPVDLTSFEAPAGERPFFAFAITPPTPDTTVVDGTDAALVDEMIAAGASHYVIGQATKDDVTKTFAWAFDLDVDLTNCRNGIDDTPGLPVTADESVEANITLHADHLLWDQFGTTEADIRFDGPASADADEDGEITVAELDAVDVATVGYEAQGVAVDTLWEFMRFGLGIAPHLNGRGLCQVRSR